MELESPVPTKSPEGVARTREATHGPLTRRRSGHAPFKLPQFYQSRYRPSTQEAIRALLVLGFFPSRARRAAGLDVQSPHVCRCPCRALARVANYYRPGWPQAGRGITTKKGIDHAVLTNHHAGDNRYRAIARCTVLGCLQHHPEHPQSL